MKRRTSNSSGQKRFRHHKIRGRSAATKSRPKTTPANRKKSEAPSAAERARAEAAVKESRQILGTVVEHIPACVCLIRGSDLRLQFVNPAYQAIAPSKEMVGKTLDELWPETAQDFAAICRRVLETGEPHHAVDELNTIRRTPGGPLERAYFSWSLHRVRLPGDEGWGLLNTAWETTSRKLAEEEIRRNKDEWERTFDSVPDLIAVLDDHHTIVRANKAMAGRLGVTPERCVGLPCYKVVHGTDAPPSFCPHSRTLSDSQVHTEEVHEERLGGDFLVTTTPLTDEEGKFLGSVHVARDITEHKRSELRIRDIAEKYSTLFDATSDGLWIEDLKGEILEVNDSYCRMSGYTRDELDHMSTSRLKVDRTPRQVQAHLRQLIKQGGQARFESKHRRKDGSVFDADVAALYLEREGGRVAVFVRDITARKEAERLSESLNTINEIIHSSLDRDTIMHRVIEEAARALECDSAAISLRSDGRWEATYVYRMPAEVVGSRMTDSQERHATLALESGGPVAINDAYNDERVDGRRMKEWGIRSVMVVPLAAPAVPTGDADKGVMFLNCHTHVHNFSEAQIDFAQRLSVSLSLAIENARLFKELSQELVDGKKTEDELARQREELQTILDSSPALIFYKDTQNRFLRVNKAMERAMGYTREQLEGKTAGDLFPKERAESYWKDDLEVLRTGKAKRGIIEVLESAHGTRIVDTDKIPCFDQAGNIVGVIGFAVDITERKRAEDELLKSRMDLERAQAVGNIGSWRLDIRNNELVWSDETYRIFGVEKGTRLTYETFLGMVHPEDRAYVDAQWNMGIAGEEYDIEHRIIVDSTVKWVREKAFLEFDEKGGLLAGFGITQDITVRKQAEEVLRRDREAFEKLVEERTAELVDTQMELERARRLSDVGVLAATVAHELRNPLAAILLAAHNVRRKAANPELDSHLATIDKKVAESDQIISNLLFYSRIKPPVYQQVDLFTVLQEPLELTEARRDKHVSNARDITSLSGVFVPADPVQLREVFGNILNNAYDAVPENGGEIAVTSRVEGEFVTIYFEDNGPGMADDIVDKVFDPFFTTKARGTGLGLTVCRQIVALHEGQIGVRPGTAGGTCVFVRLPRVKPGGNKTDPDNRR